MKINVAVADTNHEYLRRLSEELIAKFDRELNISIFSSSDFLRDSLNTQKFDVLLFDKSVFLDINLKNVKLPILLIDIEDNFEIGELNKVKKIQKYQGINKIVSCFIEMFSDVSENINIYAGKRDDLTRVTVYSPTGGSGKTVVAVAIAMLLAKAGKNVMYVNLESFNSTAVIFGDSNNRGLSELFSKLGSDINIGLKFQSLLQVSQSSNISYMSKFDNIMDVYDINSEDMEKFILAADATGVIDTLVFDLSSALTVQTMSVLNLSDKIVLTTNQSDIATYKLSLLAMQTNLFTQYSDKMKLVINKSCNRSEIEKHGIQVIGNVPEFNVKAIGEISRMIVSGNFIEVNTLL